MSSRNQNKPPRSPSNKKENALDEAQILQYYYVLILAVKDLKKLFAAWYERRQMRKIYSHLLEGLLALYLGFEWIQTDNILAPMITHGLWFWAMACGRFMTTGVGCATESSSLTQLHSWKNLDCQ
ncbi:hypothetical protein J5N97_000637 [Dioscorea zingiberensis]|uniref:Uncharacterized protein n=1 Tax=Dioscorea zingiberensis TaxID=325984 RepID=A0A9D5BV94_9LILI|nr:hypothetical protein J5N97_000637 [Dioscorea zingiberensis]